jgi:hypothetical protein
MSVPDEASDATRRITEKIEVLADWRGETMARIRDAVLEADPRIEEQWKWNTPVWARNGLVCSAAAFKSHVKLSFFQGAALPDADGLFNAGLDAKGMRSIDFHEGDDLDEAAIVKLVRAAVALNSGSTPDPAA